MASLLARLTALSAIALAAPAATTPQPSAVFSTTCKGKTYTYKELAGYGFVPSNARDRFGDSISLGSSIAIASWSKNDDDEYEGKLYGLPDRGWNTQGTVNYQPRIHEFTVTLTLASNATAAHPSPPNLKFVYEDTILLSGPDGKPMTGLDADQVGGLKYPEFPILPASTYKGDGFGGAGPGDKRVTLDAEALVLAKDGGFWISDEYGPYTYKFDKKGKMTAAVAPPDAILPVRNSSVSFSSNNPPIYDPLQAPNPTNPSHGRQNNQGFEGMTASPDGKSLWVLLQSAARQEGGSSPATRRNTRLLQYAVKKNCSTGRPALQYKAEYVVPLPTFTAKDGKTLVAAQSEMHFVSNTQFFFLPRDSGNGHGLSSSESIYRHIDVFDISEATNVKGTEHDSFNGSIASAAGVVNAGIKPATVCPFIDFNINSQLNRFGLHNGGAQDAGLLNEKWEGIALVPVEDDDDDDDDEDDHGDAKHDGHNDTEEDEYFMFASSDNDFTTQNGFINFGQIPYADKSGFNLDNQMLVFRVTLPKGSKPLVG